MMPVSQAKGACEEQDSALCSPKARGQSREFYQAASRPTRSFLLPTDTYNLPPPHFSPPTCPRFILPLLEAFRDPTPAERSLALPLVKVRSLEAANLPSVTLLVSQPSQPHVPPAPAPSPHTARTAFLGHVLSSGPNSHNLFSASMKLSVSLENQNSESGTHSIKSCWRGPVAQAPQEALGLAGTSGR